MRSSGKNPYLYEQYSAEYQTLLPEALCQPQNSIFFKLLIRCECRYFQIQKASTKFASHAFFLRKSLEDALQQNKEVNDKKHWEQGRVLTLEGTRGIHNVIMKGDPRRTAVTDLDSNQSRLEQDKELRNTFTRNIGRLPGMDGLRGD